MKLKHAIEKKRSIFNAKFPQFLKSTTALFIAVLILTSVVFSTNWLPKVNAEAKNNGQTKYKTVTDYQKARWGEIQKEIFGTSGTSVVDPSTIRTNYSVKSGNQYFNWVNTGLSAWNGTTTNVTASSTKEKHTYGSLTANYTVYNVDTPAKFRYVIQNFNSLSATAESNRRFIKINITKDLDMGGQNGAEWAPVDLKFCRSDSNKYRRMMYIEGNGHTIYNLKICSEKTSAAGCGIMSNPPMFMVVKNLGFMSSMMLNCRTATAGDTNDEMQSGLICAYTPQKMYMYNVHSSGGYYQNADGSGTEADRRKILGGIGGLVGRKNIVACPQTNWSSVEWEDCGDTFFENCSTEKLYAYAENHIGGFSSFMCTKSKANEYTYGQEFPETPEQYVFDTGFLNSNTMSTTSSTVTAQRPNVVANSSSFPIMLKNCSTTDCELFSVGNDSGAFISCGVGHVMEGCFTNNTLYSSDNSGGFIGRVDSTKVPCIKDSTGDYKLSSYYKDCYASGIIEGKIAMGGFTGLDNSWRDRTNVHKVVTSKSGEGNYSTNKGATVYENCYSTAMVGMDYAGKYVGGFIGLDDNYNSDATVVSDGKTFKGNGSFYLNCYAGGEVGNILTITDVDDPNTITLENNYFGKNNGGTSSITGDENVDTSKIILDYYPTGGFAGVVGLDHHITFRKTGAYANGDPSGVFHNCYYDMQTTAMHEMAVGFSTSKSSRIVDGKTLTANNEQYSLDGVKGYYTERSDIKSIEGLTDMTTMDGSGVNSAVWTYADEYYPQLSRYMTSDIAYSDIADTTTANANAVSSSGFYIKEDKTATSNEYSVPVLSLGGAKNTSIAVAQMAQVVRAYRVSQASTATALLDHWDVVMDTDSGLLENEGTEWQAEARNKLTQYYVDKDTEKAVATVRYYEGNEKDGYKEVGTAAYATKIEVVDFDGNVYATMLVSEGYYRDTNGNRLNSIYDVPQLKYTTDEWRISYENLDKADYEFKLEEGLGAINLNYGIGGYNGGDMILPVPKSGCDVTIRFHYGELYSDQYYVIAEFYDNETGDFIDRKIITKGNGATIPGGESSLYARGSWTGDWAASNIFSNNGETDSDGNVVLSTTIKMEAGTYDFKVASADWNINYGIDGEGGGDNMRFTLTEDASVTLKFNTETHITTVYADPTTSLIDILTTSGDKVFYLRGDFNNWEAKPESLLAFDGNYTYTYVYKDLPAGKYGFKIANSDWSESYGKDGGNTDMSITLSAKTEVTFTFDYKTKLTTVKANPETNLTLNQTTSAAEKVFYVRGEFNGWGTEGKMKTTDHKIFTYTCEDLETGVYEFKIGTRNWEEGYGFDGNDNNMSFRISGMADVTFTFNYETKLTTVTTNPENYLTEVSTATDTKKTFFVRGDFNGWGTEGKMKTQDDVIYTYTTGDTVEAGTHEFKIGTKNWSEGYGFDGGEGNMSLTLKNAAYLTFTFNYSTKITTVTADPAAALTKVNTETKPYEGYSVIASRDITGKYDWLPAGQEKEASEAGALTDPDEDGWFTKTFNVSKYYSGTSASKYDKVHSYKIIQNQNDHVATKYFYLQAPNDETDENVQVTFHYNPITGEAYVTTDDHPNKKDVYQYAYGVTSYAVSGESALTGHEWDPSKGTMSFDASSSRYTKTYTNIPAGTYSFEIVGNGNYSSGIKFGNRYGDVYSITLNQTADVKIKFNHISGIITVESLPEEAMYVRKYVVSGTANLTGDDESWLDYKHVMNYNDNDDRHYYEFKRVFCNDNYSYKITEVGVGDVENINFHLDADAYAEATGKSIAYADIKIMYDEGSRRSTVFVYDSVGNDITKYIYKDGTEISFYSVLGDKDLTGYNWGVDESVAGASAEAGRMSLSIATKDDPNGNYSRGDNLWKKTFTVEAPYTNRGKSYGFKVAANGTWDSGISYGEGGLNGGNVLFTVSSINLSDGDTRQSCKVDIYFNETTKRIFIEYEDNLYRIDLTTINFDWYVVGSRGLTSLESRKSDPMVYDTVRDITRRFRFTSGMNGVERGVTWDYNNIMNASYGFLDDIEFSLDYSVKAKKSKTEFDSPVVDLTMDAVLTDGGKEYTGEASDSVSLNDLIADHYVESFAPGKQWLTVTTTGYGYSDSFTKWKTNILQNNRYKRLYEEYKEVEESYLNTLKGFKFNGAQITSANVVEYCKYLKSSGIKDFEDVYNSLVETYTDIIPLYEKVRAAECDEDLMGFEEWQAKYEAQYGTQQLTGKRHLRLIPTAYIEAGVDASVNVIKSDYARTNEEQNDYAENIVKYKDKTSDNLVRVSNTGSTALVSTNKYDKYNLAFTAGYLATDKIGLGIYTNYKNQGSSRDQGIEKYGVNGGTTFRDDLNPDHRIDNQYFAMSTVFTEDDSYSDNYNSSKNTYNNGIAVDRLMEQSVIGPAYDRSGSQAESDKGKKAQTIVKIYKQTSEGLSKVIMDPASDAKGAYANNYRKWIGGDKQFTADDIGTYTVSFYWALSDGRYLEDSKEVIVRAITSGLTKAVDIEYTTKGDNKQITYTLTYSNGSSIDAMNFSIMDVLPHNGDGRINTSVTTQEGEEPVSVNTTMSNDAMELKTIKITQTSGAQVKGLYYSKNKNLRNHMRKNGTLIRSSATELNLTDEGLINDSDGSWVTVSGVNSTTGRYPDKTYTINAADTVALALSGKVIAPNQKIIVEYVVEADLRIKDYITNNGYYDVISVEDSDMRKSSISNHVVTAVIGRELSGYVWWDIDGDGEIDSKLDDKGNPVLDSSGNPIAGEAFVEGVKVQVYKLNYKNKYELDESIDPVVTGKDGYYHFDGLDEGNYMVVFTAADGKHIYVNGTAYEYNDVFNTRERNEIDYDGIVGSRNLGTDTEGLVDDVNGVAITNRVMPSNEEVYSGNLSAESGRNGTIENQNYGKSYQNIGLTFNTDYGVKVHKTTDTNTNVDKNIIDKTPDVKLAAGSNLYTLGSDSTSGSWSSMNGSSATPTQATTAATEAKKNDTLYFVPFSDWKNDGARFAAYFFGDGEIWASAEDSDGDGVYEIKVPEGNWTKVIFCRMNPSNATNDWGNKWNQTGDITLVADKNCFTMQNAWDGAQGAWSNFGVDASEESGEKTYTIVGYIEGKNVGCDEDFATVVPEYNFIDGEVVITFATDSYVLVKSTDNTEVYMFDGYCTSDRGVMYNTATYTPTVKFDKMYVPAGTHLFKLVQVGDESFRLSYKEYVPENVDLASNKIYFKPNTEWKKGDVRFAAYFSNATDGVWINMADSNDDGIFEGYIPDGTWTNVSFRRMKTSNDPLEGAKFALEYKASKAKVDANGNAVIDDKTGEPVMEEGWYAVYFSEENGELVNKSRNLKTYEEISNGSSELSKEYTIVGSIDGKNVGCEDDWQNKVPENVFVNGRVTLTFKQESYVFIKTTADSPEWYMFDNYTQTKSGILYKTTTGSTEKMKVPAGTVTFILEENRDGTLTLTYFEGTSASSGYIYEFVTDENGDLAVDGLDPGSYRLTEIEAPTGSRLLTSSIYFDLPYKVEFEVGADGKMTYVGDGSYVDPEKTAGDENFIGSEMISDNRGYNYFSHVSFTITDPSLFGLPLTGHNGLFVPAIIGIALLAVAAMLFIKSGKKKKETALKH